LISYCPEPCSGLGLAPPSGQVSPLLKFFFGCPPPLVKGLQRVLEEVGDLTLRQQTQALGLTLLKINDWVRQKLPINLTTPTHSYKPGDAVWVKEWNVQQLKSHWRGPFVVFSIPTTVKVAEIIPCIHHN
jgi:hypothetical protein